MTPYQRSVRREALFLAALFTVVLCTVVVPALVAAIAGNGQ